jgi:hypothetical protein
VPRMRARCDEQPIERDLLGVVERDRAPRHVQPRRAPARAQPNPIVLIPVGRDG